MDTAAASIIVTSAGTASAISVIKALRLQKEIAVQIIAVDTDPLAPGLFLADHHRLIPPASDPAYFDSLIRISKEFNVSVLIPVHSKEVGIVSGLKEKFEQNGIHTFIPSVDAVELCNDKHRMYQFVAEHGISIPRTYSISQINQITEHDLPLFTKPNSGSSSRGAEKVSSLTRLKELASLTSDLVIQQFIDAQEVTIDVLCDEHFHPIVVAPRMRLSTKSGQSVKGKSLAADRFIPTVTKISKALSLQGPCNMQFFVTDTELYFIEVNPRFAAGGLMLTVKSGANIPLLVLKKILRLPIKEQECRTRAGMIMTRYWEEVIFHEDEL